MLEHIVMSHIQLHENKSEKNYQYSVDECCNHFKTIFEARENVSNYILVKRLDLALLMKISMRNQEKKKMTSFEKNTSEVEDTP